MDIKRILSLVRYDAIIKRQIIPDINSLNLNVPIKKFPAWVYKTKSTDRMEIFIFYLIRKMLSQITLNSEIITSLEQPELTNIEDLDIQMVKSWTSYMDPNSKWQDIIHDINFLVSLKYNNQLVVPEEQIKDTIKRAKIIFEDLQKRFTGCGNIEFGQEFQYKNITANFDITGVIVDKGDYFIKIKTTSSFNAIKKDLWLELLASAAILRNNGLDIKYIGIYLPLHCDLLFFDIGNVGLNKYLDELVLLKENLYPIKQLEYIIPLHSLEFSQKYGIGNHFSRAGLKLAEAINRFISSVGNVPGQIFIYPRNKLFINDDDDVNDPSIIDEEYAIAKNLITINNLRIFIHSQYTINLCYPYIKNNTSSDKYVLKLIKQNLIKGKLMGSKGVVVHTGTKNESQTLEEALDRMELTIRLALEEASTECPLILETPAGEGNDVLINPYELLGFYLRFSEEERTKLKICIDTCHVFAAGYQPLEYLVYWIERAPAVGQAVILIHFNDSATHFGSCIDRHAMIGEGYIDAFQMFTIAQIAFEHKIPMVRE